MPELNTLLLTPPHTCPASVVSQQSDGHDTTQVAILGAGFMGISIAAVHLRCGVPVLLYDTNPDTIASIPARLMAAGNVATRSDRFPAVLKNRSLRRSPLRGAVIPPSSFPAAMKTNIRGTTNLADISPCQVVIETIPERLRLKQKLYQQLSELSGTLERNENHEPTETKVGPPLLLTNTSTIPISKLAGAFYRPDRLCGFHFFHPVLQRRLTEIIPSDSTSSETIEMAKSHALRIDQIPLVVRDTPGFLVNRLLHPYFSTALELLQEGNDIVTVDTAAVRAGFPRGPFQFMDEIGIDVVLHAGAVLQKNVAQTPAVQILFRLLEDRHLGCKTGCGFYRYAVAGNPSSRKESLCELCVSVVNKNNDLAVLLANRLQTALQKETFAAREEGYTSVEIQTALEHGLGFSLLFS